MNFVDGSKERTINSSGISFGGVQIIFMEAVLVKTNVKNFSMEPTQGQKALLVSPVLHRPNCVSFWYRLLPNSTVGTLNVYSRPTNMLGTQTLLWTNQGQENLGWTKAQITFKKQHQHNNLQIIIKGVTGPESDIRIKNLYVGQCG
eukprot:XP_017947974.1 PREDICTED: thyroid hormone-induced protein B-like isoform X2 [Xenopus tropicalis]